jgi:hypothetical protein
MVRVVLITTLLTVVPRPGAAGGWETVARETRDCKGGEPQQNTYRRLLNLLGPRPKPEAAKSKAKEAKKRR